MTSSTITKVTILTKKPVLVFSRTASVLFSDFSAIESMNSLSDFSAINWINAQNGAIV